jgi:hypothetical protein
MARHNPLWIQALTYPAGVDRDLMAALWPNGAAAGAMPSAVLNTLNITVPAGTAAVPLTDGTVAVCRWDAPETVSLAAGPGAGTSRIDLVVVQVRDATLGGTNNDFLITQVVGTPAASPVPPALGGNQYALMRVLVPANVANLNTATLTDMRQPMSVQKAGAYTARAYRNAALSLGTNGTTVPLDASSFGPAPVGGALIVPYSGRYQVFNMASIGNAVASDRLQTQILKNGAAVSQGPNTICGAGGFTMGAMGADFIDCAAGDAIGLGTWLNPASRSLNPGTLNTYMSIALVG